MLGLLIVLLLLEYFNSIKVQLEPLLPIRLNETPFDFNSIKVQLELTFHTVICLRLRYFNSIKVQLELKRLNYVLFHISVFQFHKGTIRTGTQR